MANLGMIGGVKPDGVSYWQSLDGSGRAHAANPDYKDYSQLFREYTFEARPGYVPVGERDGRTVYAAPDYMRGADGNYVNVSAADAERIARERGSLIPTRDEYKALTGQAQHIPMPTFPNGVGDNAVYTQRVGDVSGPVVHGKEFFGSGNVDAVNYWANAKTAKPTTSPIRNYADAIAAVESRGSGDYSAVGPVVKGNRAYGRYQVMGFNIGPWTEKYLGRRMTPQEFLASPEAQDAVFNGEFGAYVERYGNPQDAASVWFTGKPLSQGGNRSDGYITGNEYVNRFNAALGSPGTNTPKPGKGAYQPGQSSGATYGNVQPGAVSGAYAYGPEPVKNALAQNPYYDPRMNALAQWEEASRIEPLQTPMIDPRSMRVW